MVTKAFECEGIALEITGDGKSFTLKAPAYDSIRPTHIRLTTWQNWQIIGRKPRYDTFADALEVAKTLMVRKGTKYQSEQAADHAASEALAMVACL